MLGRDSKLFLRCLAAASLLMLLLASVCALAAGGAMMNRGDVFAPVEIALIDYEDSVISRILIGMVMGSDYLSDVLSVKSMDEADAMDSLSRGDCAAVIILPEGFLDNIFYGRESAATIYLSRSAASQADVVEAVARFGERLLLAGQAGVFAGENVLREHEIDYELREQFNNDSNLRLIEEAMGTTKRYFRVEVLDYLDTGLSTASHYGLCWLTLLLMLISLFFAPMLQRDCTPEMLRRLRTLGVGHLRFMQWKLILPALFRLLIVTLAFVVAGEYLQITWSGAGVISVIVSVCFITMVGTAITMCMGDGITANVIFGIGGMVLSGGLIPRQLLPEALRLIGDLSPFGVAANLMKPAFGGGVSIAVIFSAVIYTLGAILLIQFKLNRTLVGGGAR